MTPDQLHELITETTNKLKHAHREHHSADQHVLDARTQLTEAEAHHTLAGLEGKNAEARKAELAALTETERADLNSAEAALAEARLTLRLAELDHQHARYLTQIHTRAMEVAH